MPYLKFYINLKYNRRFVHASSNNPAKMKDINTLSNDEKRELLNSLDAVFTDCDGVLWLGSKIIPRAHDTINQLKELNKKIFFVTNNSTKTRKDLLESSTKFGFNVTFEEMVTTAWLTAIYLKSINFTKKAYVVGRNSIAQELAEVGIQCYGPGPDVYVDGKTVKDYFQKDPDVNAVIVGHDIYFSYPKMIKACNYLTDPNCLFIATNTDPSLPVSENLINPGAGCFVKAVEACSGRKPLIIGKPSKTLGEELIKVANLNRHRVMMVGDRCDTDIAFANDCGLKSLLVLSGVETLQSVNNYIKENKKHLIPDYYANSIADLIKLIEVGNKKM